MQQEITSEESRAFVLCSIVISTGIFSIAFYYGVFGTIFFDHLFYVWVASTVALIASMFVPSVDALPAFLTWRGRFVLVLPTLFLFWQFFTIGNEKTANLVYWIEWILTIIIMGLTLPYLMFVIIMVVIPDVERLTTPKLQIAILCITFGVFIAGLLIGKNHNLFVTCDDFAISGNYLPNDCNKTSGLTLD